MRKETRLEKAVREKKRRVFRPSGGSIAPSEFYYVPKVPKEKQKKVNWTQLAGTTAAGTLGFIAEGVPGAITAGVSAYDYLKDNAVDYVSPKKVMKTSVVNVQAGRAAMKKSGKVKSVKKGKVVRVSKSLRDKVKEVMKGASYSGSYNAFAQGQIGCAGINANKTTNTVFSAALGTIPGILTIPIQLIPRYDNSHSGTWTYWGAAFTGNFTNTPAPYHNQFEHFSPLQFLDAASKLWNCKYGTAASWYAHDEKNIQLNVNRNTGVGQNPSASAQPAMVGDLKLNIVNSYVKYSFRNTSARAMTVEIFHCTPKLKFPGNTALNDLLESVEAELWGVDQAGDTATAPNPRAALFQTENSTATNMGSVTDLMQHLQFDPKDSVQFKSRWNYQKVTLRIQGGETCEHSIQGPKNVLLDYSKIVQLQGGNPTKTIPPLVKGYSVSVFMRTMPDMVPVALNDQVIDANVNVAGNFDATRSTGLVGKKICLPIAVQMEYGYQLKCPEQAGFLQQAVSAGAAQYLNLKRKSRRFDNLTRDPIFPSAAVAPTNYRFGNEENPITQATGGVEQ